MESAYPVLLIVIGAVVLLLGKRLPVLAAAVGALLGVSIVHFFPGIDNGWVRLIIVAGLTIGGFFLTSIAKGVIDIVLIVICALAGATVLTELFSMLGIGAGLEWLWAIIGGVVGWLIFSRFHETALAILAGLVGAVLITRGLTMWIPSLNGWLGTLLVIVLAGGGIGVQTGFFANRKAAQAEKAAAQAQATAAAPAAPVAAPAPTVAPVAVAPAPVAPVIPPVDTPPATGIPPAGAPPAGATTDINA